MCNLSEYVLERGEKRGREKGLAEGRAEGMVKAFTLAAKSLMQKVDYSAAQAMEMLQVPQELRTTVAASL